MEAAGPAGRATARPTIDEGILKGLVSGNDPDLLRAERGPSGFSARVDEASQISLDAAAAGRAQQGGRGCGTVGRSSAPLRRKTLHLCERTRTIRWLFLAANWSPTR